MKQQTPWSLLAPLTVCVLLTGWIALSAVNLQTASLSLLIYALANLIVYTDAVDFILRLHVRRRHIATAPNEENRHLSIDITGTGPAGGRQISPLRPYAIIASIHNLEPLLDEFMDAFAAYRDRVWLISDGSTDSTVVRLRRAGWRCFDDGVNRRKPAAIKRLLERLPAHIETVLVVDPDIRIRGRDAGSRIDFERFVRDFQQSGAAAVCPRVMIEEDGFLARFQAFEYALAFRIGRESLADYSITSGVSCYRRDALERALAEHSHSVYAEDLENALILLSHGERIYYDGRLVVSTEGPGNVPRWFSQRVGWYYGLIKVYTERFGKIWTIAKRTPFSMYHFVLYLGGLSLIVHPLKIVSALLLVLSFVSGFDNLFLANVLPRNALINPAYFIAAIGSYLALGVFALFTVVPKAERAYIAPIVPLYLFYAITHIVPMTVGYMNWISMKLRGRRLYHDHYEPLPSASTSLPLEEKQEPMRRAS